MARIKIIWFRLPVWLQKAITDFVETFLGVLVALNLVIPSSLDQAKAEGLLVVAAAATAAVAAARRAAPVAWAWLVAQWQAA